MRKATLLICLVQATILSYGQIIADHNAVSEFDSIPAEYVAEVKKMMVAFPGESHSEALRSGLELLEAMEPTFASNVATAEAYTEQHLRVEDFGWIGEDTWFTWHAYDQESRPYSVSTTIKNLISSYHTGGHPITALGFGWCYDMLRTNQSDLSDTIYEVSWRGSSSGGPDGDLGWGLDDEDFALTGNRVSLQTYFEAMEEYITFSDTNSFGTKMVFTTGPVDSYPGYWLGEGGYQGHLKHEAIREYVRADSGRILFDYADILCHSADGVLSTLSWDGHVFPVIDSANEVPVKDYHISEAGAIRLAKAQWWMLARIAGWEGVIPPDTLPPSAPDEVEVTAFSETTVDLSWNASSDQVGVAAYHIYRSDTLIGSTAELIYTDSLASCGEFIYRVSATDLASNESDKSAGVQVNTCKLEDPDYPDDPDNPLTPVQLSPADQVSIYPNPSNGQFMIHPGKETGGFTMQIFSISGSIITRKELYFSTSPLYVNLDDFPAGVYLIRIYNDEHIYRAKHVIR